MVTFATTRAVLHARAKTAALVLLFAALVLAFAGGHARAACTVPNQLTNGQTADATLVMGNYNAVAACADSSVKPSGSPTTGSIAAFASSTSIANATSNPNTVLANPTNVTGAVQAFAMPNCIDTSGQHLNYASGTGFTCGASSGGGPSFFTGSLTLIQQQTLSAARASVTFSSIPSGYSDLVVVTNARGDTASASTPVNIQFNGDTGANYDRIDLQVNSKTNINSVVAQTSMTIGYAPAASAPANVADTIEAQIASYAGTAFQKAVNSVSTLKTGTTTSTINAVKSSGWWRSTASVTSITVIPGAGNFVAGSSFSLYGRGGAGVTVNPAPGLPVIQEVVTSGSQSSVTVAAIPSTYRDLMVVVTGRGTASAADVALSLTFNSDGGANYDNEQFFATNTTATANTAGDTKLNVGNIAAATAPASTPGHQIINIQDYAGTAFYKTVSAKGSEVTATSAGAIVTMVASGQWRNTSPITSLTIAPASGAFVDGTTVTVYGIGGSPTATLPVVPPQGRLTLTANTPIMSADATAQATIYYAPFVGTLLPVGNIMYRVGQLSYALNTTAHVSGRLYDIGAFNNSGTISLCTAPAWGSPTVRSAAIQQDLTNGIWVNASSVTCNLSGGTTTLAIAPGQWTYLGTLYATANGQTGMAFGPNAAAGGTNNFLGLYNAYNRVRLTSVDRDSTTSWVYGSATWRNSDNSAGNRVSWVDGLGQSTIDADFSQMMGQCGYDSTYGALNGLVLDAAAVAPIYGADNDNATCATAHVSYRFAPATGFHFIQGVEAVTGPANKGYFTTGFAIRASLDM